MSRLDIPKDIVIRTIGLAMMTFPIGMGVGSAMGQGWLIGGLMAFGASALGVISFLGVVLTWSGKAGKPDIQNAFRTAAAKAAEDNEDIKEVVDTHVKEKK